MTREQWQREEDQLDRAAARRETEERIADNGDGPAGTAAEQCRHAIELQPTAARKLGCSRPITGSEYSERAQYIAAFGPGRLAQRDRDELAASLAAAGITTEGEASADVFRRRRGIEGSASHTSSKRQHRRTRLAG